MAELEHLEALKTEDLNLILDSVRYSDPLEAITILGLIADRAYAEDDYEATIKWHTQIIEIAKNLKAVEREADSLKKSGVAHHIKDDCIIAIECFKSAQAKFEEIGNDKEILACLVLQADCYDELEDYDSLIKSADIAINIARVLEDFEQIGEMAIYLADAYYRLESANYLDVLGENHKIGLEFAEEALRNFESTGDQLSIARAICEICEALFYFKRYAEVEQRISAAIETIRSLDLNVGQNKKVLAKALRIKATYHRHLDENSEAILSLEEAQKIMESPELTQTELQLGFIHLTKSYCYESTSEIKNAIDEIQIALKYAITPLDQSLYYRCLRQYVLLLYYEDRVLEALFICRGAMTEYEVNSAAKLGPDFYFFFIRQAGTCLHALDRWSEILLTLEKISLTIDYIPFPSEAIRIDALKAEALFKLDRSEESLVVLDALLNFGELDETDEDIGDSFLVRAAILKNKDFAKASTDFQYGSKILISQKLDKRVQGFIQENPEFEGLTN